MAEEVDKKAADKVIPRVIEDEVKQSFLDYAMSVIVSRALPDVRDGLKPVHRRILYAMHDMGMLHNKPYKKSARIVGEVLGKYHPHGDTAVYDAMVRMAQPWSLRYLLVDGQGNFGSIDGDSAAAMRYTEARMDKMAEEMLQDIDKETVNFVDNFDGSLQEPSVLPSKIPNLLVNGSSGIAVGMATNIPTHNLSEVIDGVVAYIEDKDITVEELMEYIPGPDFPTGALVAGKTNIKKAYKTGRGKVTLKAVAKEGEDRIILTELPYMVNKAQLIEQIADLVKKDKVSGIRNIRDESDREGIRVVIELKKGAESSLVLNRLYAYSRMKVTFGINTLALVDGEPKVLNLKDLILLFVNHRQKIVRKRTQYDLDKAEERAHILEGLIIAIDDIDNVVQGIKKSEDTNEAKNFLVNDYDLSDKQAKAILEMRLQKLAGLEQEKIRKEHKELEKKIEELKSILSSKEKILNIIKEELKELKEKYGDERRTKIIEGKREIKREELIEEEQVVVTKTNSGYIKRIPLSTYRVQKRGGKGVIATGKKEEDYVEEIFVASTHDYLLFFTNKGKVYWKKVYELPVGSRQARGKPIVNLLRLGEEESIKSLVNVGDFSEDKYLVFSTKKGTAKRVNLKKFSRPRKGGIRAIKLRKGDNLIEVMLTDGKEEVILATKKGMAIRFSEKDLRPMGRNARGVRGIKLKEEDEVVGMGIAEKGKNILTVTEKGYGKKTKVEDYRLINRGGKGVINLKVTEDRGNVATVKVINGEDQLLFISEQGIVIRVASKDISTMGRATQGVRLMKLSEGDKLVDVAKVEDENISDNG